MQNREALVAAAFAGGGLTAAEIALLCREAHERSLTAGAVIAVEGDDGACYVVALGRVALTQAVHGTSHVVGTAGAGDAIGAENFVSSDHRQAATANATSDVELLELDTASLQRLVAENPALAQFVAARAEQALLERLVRASASFDGVSSQEMSGLVHAVQRRTAPAGTDVVKQGAAGTEAFVIVAGRVEIIDEAAGRTLATLGPGALFGEAALLGDVARNATVRAVDETALLVLARDPLLNVLDTNASARARMIDLLNSRDRPCRAPGIEVNRRTDADGNEIAVLKNPAHHSYFRLSGDGLFLWDRSDGTQTIRDLATALFSERRHFAPQEIIGTIAHLRAEGYLRAGASLGESLRQPEAPSRWGRILGASRRVLTASLHFDRVDPLFAAAYRALGPALFSRPSAGLLSLVSVAGVVFFALSARRAIALLWTPHGFAWFFLLALPAYALLIVLHECGHGLGVKAIGRRVESIGIGWYWFGPVAFVDTSDAWVGTRAQRVLVSTSGLAVNLVFGAAASAIAFWTPVPLLALAAWQFALAAYIGFVENLNPLLEFDGYYILVDLLDRPNLRRQSLHWLGSEFRNVTRRPALVRGHVVECSYAVGAILYIFFAAAQSTVMYHVVGRQRLEQFLPAGVASMFAWVLPLVLAALALAALSAEIRKVTSAGLR
ncbi:MAG: cyclic nucleotide-binding domain-containing protein [Vulcanimicrobiaceae bacterium]